MTADVSDTHHLLGWNVGFCENQGSPWNQDDALIWSTTGTWRQLGHCNGGDVRAYHREVACFQLKNVRATPSGSRGLAIRVRIRPKTSQNHAKT